jgi:hypothetical protein
MFNFCSPSEIYASAGCASAADVYRLNFDEYGTEMASANRIIKYNFHNYEDVNCIQDYVHSPHKCNGTAVIV